MKKLKSIQFPEYAQEIIKKVCQVQIESLERVNAIDTLIDIRNIGYDVTPEELDEDISSQIKDFEMIIDNPNDLLILDDINMSLFKHNLFNYYWGTKEQSKAAKIWAALVLSEEILICLN